MKKKIINERLPISESSPLKARFYDYAHFTYPWHFHPEYEIIYIREGSGTRFIGDDIHTYKAGDVLLIGSNLPHYMKSDDLYFAAGSNLRVTGTIIQFEKGFMQHSIHNYPQFSRIKQLLADAGLGIYFPSGCSVVLVELLDKIPVESGVDQITSFLQLLKEMAGVHSGQTISTPDYTNDRVYEDASRIDKVISYINKNYTRHIELEEVASFAAMNPAAFCRFFKSKTGKSLTNYVQDMRIGYACKLLLMNDSHIAQISMECGFETVSHFNKTFKKNTGYTPSEYKKKCMFITTLLADRRSNIS